MPECASSPWRSIFYLLLQVFPWVTCESPRNNTDKIEALHVFIQLHNINLTVLRLCLKTYFTTSLTKQKHFLPYQPSKHSLNTPHSSFKTHLTIPLLLSPQHTKIPHTSHWQHKSSSCLCSASKTVPYHSSFLFQRLPNYTSRTRLLSWN